MKEEPSKISVCGKWLIILSVICLVPMIIAALITNHIETDRTEPAQQTNLTQVQKKTEEDIIDEEQKRKEAQSVYDRKYEDYLRNLLNRKLKLDEVPVRISIDFETVEYHSVGRDISYLCNCNYRSIKDGAIIPDCSLLDFEVVVTEDDAIPDVGKGYVRTSVVDFNNFKFNKYSQSLEKTVSCKVRVDEQGGTNKGAYGIYKISFTVEPVLDDIEIDFWDVVNS